MKDYLRKLPAVTTTTEHSTSTEPSHETEQTMATNIENSSSPDAKIFKPANPVVLCVGFAINSV